jgi:hypothetical protein
MDLPPYFLPRPGAAPDAATQAAFARLFAEAIAPGTGAMIPYTLAAPKWQFLNWLGDTQAVLLHGSGSATICEFEPRQSNDMEDFGNRMAVYAASDGLWALFFAISERDHAVTSTLNACFRLVDADGSKRGPYYFFSVNESALMGQPWRDGTVYILPRAPFEQQPPQYDGDQELEVAQWASLVPVRPLARLAVTPADFPFLAQVHGHDIEVVLERAARNRGGFPWLEE